jgi:hypothetical protein
MNAEVLPRPELTDREAMLLRAAQLMKGWVVAYIDYTDNKALQRDLSIARLAIAEATGGNEE